MHVLELALFVLPLGLDTFAVTAALGAAGLPARERTKVGLAAAGFEAGMPLVGLAAGHGLGHALGGVADWVAAAALLALGLWMLRGGEDEPRAAAGIHGLALLALGLSISLDELAIGFAIGLLRLPPVAAVVLIGAQAFLVAQLGLRLGARLHEAARERAERLAGLALVALAAFVVLSRS